MPAKGWKSYEKNEELAEIKKGLASLDSKMKGSIAESYVMLRLAELGFDVWLPYMNNHKADLAVCQDGRLISIQVKSAGFDMQSDRFRAMLTTRDKTGKHILPSASSQDFFIVKCEGVMAYYVIPSPIGLAHHSVNFYPHRTRTWVTGETFDAEVYRDAFDLIKNFDGR